MPGNGATLMAGPMLVSRGGLRQAAVVVAGAVIVTGAATRI